MFILNLMGSQAGWIIVVVIGVIILLILNKLGFFKGEGDSDSCLERIFVYAFIIAFICAFLYMCVEIAQE